MAVLFVKLSVVELRQKRLSSEQFLLISSIFFLNMFDFSWVVHLFTHYAWMAFLNSQALDMLTE